MSKILIIGNILKDVYLKLDERTNDFEEDDHGIAWLDLEFNGAAHQFYHRTSVYGGAAVSLTVLGRLGIEASIMGSSTAYKQGEVVWGDKPSGYRYVFCKGGEITYFVPSNRQPTSWAMPKDNPEWILVDRSATISAELVDEIRNFRKFSPATKLAVHAEKHHTPAGRQLCELADVLFLEDEPPVHNEDKIVDKIDLDKPSTQIICHISPKKIVMGEAEESWNLSRTDMLTHLTVYSTIVATVLGVISAGGSAAEAVLWARLNAEHATLEASLSGRKLKELAEAEHEKRRNLKIIAQAIMSPRHGVLAMDESDPSLTERLIRFGIPATEGTRREYRNLVLTTPNLRDYASGIIISPKTAYTIMPSSTSNYAEYLISQGIIVGLEANTGYANLPGTSEPRTLGEQDLPERLRKYYDLGVRFAKWQAKFTIGKDQPGFIAVEENAKLLASFARECQLAGLVPMIESNIHYDGDFTIEKMLEVTDRVLTTIFDKLERRRVDLSSLILKTNMVVAGKQSIKQASTREIGLATAAVLRHAVSRHTAGVLLLSGGQDAKVATSNLAAVTQEGPFPWPISFAFGRALTDSVLATWKGKNDNLKSAQAALKRKLEDNIDVLKR